VRVIPNGLGDADFVAHQPADDAADFLFVGELRLLKGVDVLINALARLNKTRATRAVIVGAGPDADEFKAMAHALNLDERVTFPGAMPARRAFAMGRALVVPSRAESLPYIVLEAGAAGMPLIATDVGGIPEIVAGTDMRLVPPGDADALARAMESILAAPDAARLQALELKRQVGSRFTVAAMTGAVLDFYAATLAR
jgi:glycosyltransferase involved in cell wall biosynthesis